MLTSIFFPFLILSSALQALVLEDIEKSETLISTFQAKRIGYYIGSFDPLHKGHEAIARQVIDEGYCDYVIIVPAWGTTDQNKSRSNTELRLDMLFASFADDPHIIVTRKNPLQLQQALTEDAPERTVLGKSTVKTIIPDARFVGVVGSDVVIETAKSERKCAVFMEGIKIGNSHKDTSVGTALALPVEEFIVSVRDEDDLLPFEGKFCNRPIIKEIRTPFHDLSATRIRQLVKEHRSIDGLVNEGVKNIIMSHNLYNFNDS